MTKVKALRNFPRLGVKIGDLGFVLRKCAEDVYEINWLLPEQMPIAHICYSDWFEQFS